MAEAKEAEVKEEALPNTVPSKVYIVAKQSIAHGGRSAWMGTQGKYQFNRGGVYSINHPIDIVYFMSNPKLGLEIYLDLPDGIKPDDVVDYSYPVDKIDINVDRGKGLGSILDEAQKRYERLV